MSFMFFASYLLMVLSGLPVAGAQGGPCAHSQITRNFPREDWQPTRAIYGSGYVGEKVCARCHVSEAATQPSTPMALALRPAADCQVLRSHPSLTVQLGRYHFRITTQHGQSIYQVSDGRYSISAPLLYALGRGNAGQTYLFKYKGDFYESQVSYFNAIQGLDLTLGHDPAPPPNLEAALGVRQSREDALRCFACHSTGVVTNSSLELDHMVSGITCEGCHGPGSDHVAAVRSGKLSDLHIFNPGKLSPSDLMDFCGSCHRTALSAAALNVSGVRTVRFQPYRLFLSRCFIGSNGGLSCLQCHDPHKTLESRESFYDSKCLACHSGHARAGVHSRFAAARCPVSNKNCVTCHMPKYAIPGSHFKFTDHDIRIVRAGVGYPG